MGVSHSSEIDSNASDSNACHSDTSSWISNDDASSYQDSDSYRPSSPSSSEASYSGSTTSSSTEGRPSSIVKLKINFNNPALDSIFPNKAQAGRGQQEPGNDSATPPHVPEPGSSNLDRRSGQHQPPSSAGQNVAPIASTGDASTWLKGRLASITESTKQLTNDRIQHASETLNGLLDDFMRDHSGTILEKDQKIQGLKRRCEDAELDNGTKKRKIQDLERKLKGASNRAANNASFAH